MRIDPDAIEASRPNDREIALLAAEVRRLQSVISNEEVALTDEERKALADAIYLCEVEACLTHENGNIEYYNMAAGLLRGLLDRAK